MPPLFSEACLSRHGWTLEGTLIFTVPKDIRPSGGQLRSVWNDWEYGCVYCIWGTLNKIDIYIYIYFLYIYIYIHIYIHIYIFIYIHIYIYMILDFFLTRIKHLRRGFAGSLIFRHANVPFLDDLSWDDCRDPMRPRFFAAVFFLVFSMNSGRMAFCYWKGFTRQDTRDIPKDSKKNTGPRRMACWKIMQPPGWCRWSIHLEWSINDGLGLNYYTPWN